MYQLTQRHTLEHFNIQLRYVILWFGAYRWFKRIITREKILKLDIIIIIIITLATDMKCSDLEVYDCKSQFRKDIQCTSQDAGNL